MEKAAMTKMDRMLIAMAMSEGMLSSKAPVTLYRAYGRLTMERARDKGYVKLKKGVSPHVYYLRPEGARYLESKYPSIKYFTRRSGNLKQPALNEQNVIRGAGISDCIKNMYLYGIPCLLDERGEFGEARSGNTYYTPREVKASFEDTADTKDKKTVARASRCNGIVETEDSLLLLYHMENGNLKFSRATELNFKTKLMSQYAPSTKCKLVVFANSHSWIERLRSNIELEAARKEQRGAVPDLITPSLYYDELYFILDGKESEASFKAICEADKTGRIIEQLSSDIQVQGGGISGLGFDEDGREIVSLFPPTLAGLERLMSERTPKAIFVSETDEEYISTMVKGTNSKLHTIKNDIMLQLLEADI